MGEQALDIRSGLDVLRRHRAVLVGATVLGLAAGVAYTSTRPPLYSSSSLVLLPDQASADQAPRDPGTEERVAGSAAVLGPAGRMMKPRLSASQMAQYVSASAPSTTVVSFEASADSPAFARKLAQAAAAAEVAYVKDASDAGLSAQERDFNERLTELNSSIDSLTAQITSTTKRRDAEGPTTAAGRADSTALAQLTAQQADVVLQRDQVKQQAQTAAAGAAPSTASIIEPAADGRRPALMSRAVKYGLIGAGLAFLIAVIGVTLFSRRDRRLRYRDQIADALGSTVVASVQASPRRTVSGWTDLLAGYEPATADAWALRQVLHQADRRLTLVSLSGDQDALAIGPQLASYAASTGVLVRLVLGQGHDSAAALWASVHHGEDQELRPGLVVSTTPTEDPRTALTITVVVLDRRTSELEAVPPRGRTLVAVSAGTVTSEELARAAVTLDDAGLRIDGMVVANPDDLDHTTGRLPLRLRSTQLSLPSRLTGAIR